jgi:hypothetical protein
MPKETKPQTSPADASDPNGARHRQNAQGVIEKAKPTSSEMESDQRWEKARSKSGGAELIFAARMLEQMAALVRFGFQALNVDNPNRVERAEIAQALKAAKDVRKAVGSCSDEYAYHRVGKIFDFIADIAPATVANAWHLFLLRLPNKRGKYTLRDVRAAAIQEEDPGYDEHPAPSLAKRMRLDDAVRNAGEDKLLKAINSGDSSDAHVYMKPGERAWLLASYALGTTASTVKHACNNLAQMGRELAVGD